MEDQLRADLNKEALDEVYGDQRQMEKQLDEERKRLLRVVVNTFDTEWGVQCLKWLSETFAEQPSFDPANQYQTAFNEGCRHVVLTINAIMKQKGEGSS